MLSLRTFESFIHDSTTYQLYSPKAFANSCRRRSLRCFVERKKGRLLSRYRALGSPNHFDFPHASYFAANFLRRGPPFVMSCASTPYNQFSSLFTCQILVLCCSTYIQVLDGGDYVSAFSHLLDSNTSYFHNPTVLSLFCFAFLRFPRPARYKPLMILVLSSALTRINLGGISIQQVYPIVLSVTSNHRGSNHQKKQENTQTWDIFEERGGF